MKFIYIKKIKLSTSAENKELQLNLQIINQEQRVTEKQTEGQGGFDILTPFPCRIIIASIVEI